MSPRKPRWRLAPLVPIACLLLFAALYGTSLLPRSSPERPQPDRILPGIAELAKRYQVTRIESLYTGELLTLTPARRFYADLFTEEEEDNKTASELLLQTKGGEVYLLTSALSEIPPGMLDAFAALPAVEVAEVNQTGSLMAEPAVSGESLLLQVFAESRPPKRPVTVALIDSGIDRRHPALAGNLWRNDREASGKQGYDDDKNGLVDDLSGWNFASDSSDTSDLVGHGTHLSGIIGAKKTAAAQMAGVNPTGVRIMALKVAGADKSLKMSSVIQALNYAEAKGVDLVNMSFGFAKDSKIFRNAVQRLTKTGTPVVAAAGNNAETKKQYPAAFAEVIAVGASNLDGSRAKSSNYGDWVDIMVPGRFVSTLPGSAYGTKSGTSQAAALVTGLLSASIAHTPELASASRQALLAEVSARLGSSQTHAAAGSDPAFMKTALKVVAQKSLPMGVELTRLLPDQPISLGEAARLFSAAFGVDQQQLVALPSGTPPKPPAAENLTPSALINFLVDAEQRQSGTGAQLLTTTGLRRLLTAIDPKLPTALSLNLPQANIDTVITREQFLRLLIGLKQR